MSCLQARSMALACTQLLEHVLLSSCTCFSILAAAWAAPAPRLAAAARRTKALSAQQLLDVLQSEDLKVQLTHVCCSLLFSMCTWYFCPHDHSTTCF